MTRKIIDAELFQKLNEGALDMAEINKIIEILFDMESRMTLFEDLLNRIDKAVNGNGKKGLCEKYNDLDDRTIKLEDRAGMIKWFVVIVAVQIISNVAEFVLK